jgi:hypothetical protein
MKSGRNLRCDHFAWSFNYSKEQVIADVFYRNLSNCLPASGRSMRSTCSSGAVAESVPLHARPVIRALQAMMARMVRMHRTINGRTHKKRELTEGDYFIRKR